MLASKWKIADTIKSIQLFGDVRFRYEYRGANNLAGASPSTFYRERFRYAFRAGIRGDLFDDFNYGIRLETSTNPRSPWATFGNTIIGTLRFGHADRINDALGTGGNNLDLPGLNPIKNYNLFQADVTWRF